MARGWRCRSYSWVRSPRARRTPWRTGHCGASTSKTHRLSLDPRPTSAPPLARNVTARRRPRLPCNACGSSDLAGVALGRRAGRVRHMLHERGTDPGRGLAPGAFPGLFPCPDARPPEARLGCHPRSLTPSFPGRRQDAARAGGRDARTPSSRPPRPDHPSTAREGTTDVSASQARPEHRTPPASGRPTLATASMSTFNRWPSPNAARMA